MKVPKVNLRYSWIYDQHWRMVYQTDEPRHNKRYPYPTQKRIKKYLQALQFEWRKHEKKLLTEMCRVTGLPWKVEQIPCYMVGRCIPFSDPLTLPVYRTINGAVDTLTHELIHCLFQQPGAPRLMQKYWNQVDRIYSKDSSNAQGHILVHAVHQHLFLKYFSEARLHADQEVLKHLPDYRRAWEIVEQEGYKKIIAELRKKVKIKNRR